MPTSTVAERPAAACVLLRGAVPPAEANALLGGKAAATDRLVGCGFDVPPSAAVTTAAYRDVATDPAVVALLDRLGVAGDDDVIGADEIDEVFLGVELPPALEEEVLRTARLVAGADGLAARSSATVEDLAGTSFAGQYRSFLALDSDADILRAVRLVWASLWHPAPRAYRRAYGVDESRIAMAVLMMRMVPSVQAGVAFTRDPGGAAGVRVESVEGLGEQLVSGDVTPTAWLVGPDHDPAPPLVERVAELGRAVEQAFGSPMDVEWAWDGSQLWLVQARPITVDVARGDGFDTAPDGSTLTTAGIAEMLPGVLGPRVWGLAGLAVEEALRRSLDGLGAVGAEPHGTFSFIRRVRGRAALDLDALKRVASAMPGASEAEVERQYFGEVLAEPVETPTRRARRRDLRILFQDARVLRARRLAIEEADDYGNLEATDPGPFVDTLGRALSAPAQAALYREVPVGYVWDDHDYGPNDAGADSPTRIAARRAYRASVPHPPLVTGRDGTINHAFTVGRVRFVLTDTRSERTDAALLGKAQEDWLLGELADADRYAVVVWVNPVPWIAPDDPTRDDWGAHADERRRIADAIAAAGVDNLIMVSGDAHMVAIDDGTNSDYSTTGRGGFPVLHAAALDRPGSVKGGPYSEGAFPGAGQFGLLHVQDDGEQVRVTLEGRNWEGRTLASLDVAFPVVGPVAAS